MFPQSKGTSIIPWATIGGILGVLALISIVIPATTVVLIVCTKRRHKTDHDERTYDLPDDYERPIAPPVGTMPPRMEMNVAYEQVKSLDMNANPAYEGIQL